jgi:hypothetical protein
VVTTSSPTTLIGGRKKGFDFFLSKELFSTGGAR